MAILSRTRGGILPAGAENWESNSQVSKLRSCFPPPIGYAINSDTSRGLPRCTVAKTNPARATKPLIPPEEALWQRYSPHFELPLASATSLFLHGLVIGLLAMGGLAYFFMPNLEATKPPRMDVVMIEGNGSGFEGLSGEAGSPGSPKGGGRTEQVAPLLDQQPDRSERPSTRPVKDVPLLDLPMIDSGPPVDSELAIELQKIAKEAEERVERAITGATPAIGADPNKKGPGGTGNLKGVGGKGDSGDGPGVGNKKGAGVGSGGPGGRKATKQDIYAWRWRFDLSGDAKEHARKLAALGVTIAIPDPKSAGFFIITDLNRRPVDMKKDNLTTFKDAVKWYNTRAESVDALARELQLDFTPKFVVLLLPKEREQKMADEEAKYAKDQRRKLESVTETWFDFRLRNGVYDPIVIRQK
jgi:hypothetical protein